MKIILLILALNIIISFTSVNWGTVHASPPQAKMSSMAIPLPPISNPHPPVTEDDKKRVAFGEMILKKFFIENAFETDETVDTKWVNSSEMSFNLSETCLNDTSCLQKNTKLKTYIQSILNLHGHVREFKHAHVIPWSYEKFQQSKLPGGSTTKVAPVTNSNIRYTNKNDTMNEALKLGSTGMSAPNLNYDEFMIHIYTRFDKDGAWYHVDVVVSEDESGNLEFRYFFIIKIPYNGGSLPHGVVC